MQGRHGRRLVAWVIATALGLAGAPEATAQECAANPNVSATAQYCETLPAPNGGVPAASAGDGAQQTLRDLLSPAQARRLAETGPLGEALLDLPANTPLTAEEERLLDSVGLIPGDLNVPASPSASGQDTLAALAQSVSAAGPATAVLAGLGVATLAALGFALLRYRLRP